jgi:cephalosporin-C deacetylase-like acetyl esterase
MSIVARAPVVVLLSLVFIQSSFAADAPAPPIKLSARTDRAEALYKKGETATFLFELTDNGQPVAEGELKWKLTKDGFTPLSSGSVKLDNGKASISGNLDEPGFLQCHVTFQKNTAGFNALAGAGYDPLELKPSLPVPDDFDAFWTAQKKKLAAVPMNPRLTPVPAPGKEPKTECADVQLDCVGEAPVSGYFAKPKDAKPKSLPIILTVHGAGVRSAGLGGAAGWAEKNFLAMDINAHGIPNGKPDAFYKELSEGKLKDYRAIGRESRETCYFVNMFLRELRALDFLCAQPEWDGKHVIVYGSSQGGFQAFAAAGLDERVTFFAAGVPAGCDHSGNVANRVAGWPKLVPLTEGKPDPKILEAARYVDNVNFATRAKAKGCIVTVGFIDTTCPPTTVYAAYNALPIPKSIHTDPLAGHTNTPGASAAMQKAVKDYLDTTK